MAELIKGSLDANIDLQKASGRSQPGLHKALRVSKHPHMYIGLNEDMKRTFESSHPVPRHIKAWFKEIFQPDQREHIAMVLHPIFKRWTIFEKMKWKGQQLWRPVVMFHKDPKAGHLPADLQREDRALHHLTGIIGEFCHPTKTQLELIEKLDLWKYGWQQVDDFMQKFIDDEENELDRQAQDYLDDFLDYNFWLAMRDAQAHYSNPWSVDGTVKVKEAPERWHIEERNGFRIRTKLYGKEGDMNEMKAALSGTLKMDSKSENAIHHVLSIKNLKYKNQYGESLWEMVTGKKKIWPDAPDLKKEENKKETLALLDLVKSSPGAPAKDEDSQTIEQFLRQLKEEKDKVPF